MSLKEHLDQLASFEPVAFPQEAARYPPSKRRVSRIQGEPHRPILIVRWAGIRIQTSGRTNS